MQSQQLQLSELGSDRLCPVYEEEEQTSYRFFCKSPATMHTPLQHILCILKFYTCQTIYSFVAHKNLQAVSLTLV